jgi:hypothetical protein
MFLDYRLGERFSNVGESVPTKTGNQIENILVQQMQNEV